MDPLTAALLLVGEIAKNWGATLAAATPEQRQQIVQMQLDDMKAWREFMKPLVAIFTHKQPEGEKHVHAVVDEGTGADQAAR